MMGRPLQFERKLPAAMFLHLRLRRRLPCIGQGQRRRGLYLIKPLLSNVVGSTQELLQLSECVQNRLLEAVGKMP